MNNSKKNKKKSILISFKIEKIVEMKIKEYINLEIIKLYVSLITIYSDIFIFY